MFQSNNKVNHARSFVFPVGGVLRAAAAAAEQRFPRAVRLTQPGSTDRSAMRKEYVEFLWRGPCIRTPAWLAALGYCLAIWLTMERSPGPTIATSPKCNTEQDAAPTSHTSTFNQGILSSLQVTTRASEVCDERQP
jgi:hypothetical protein